MSLNENSYRILHSMKTPKTEEEFGSGRVTVIDVGLKKKASLETALLISEASLGGLGKITVDDFLHVSIPRLPAVATLGCQLAGWRIDQKKGVALGSGPVRLLAKKPRRIISKLNYSESSSKAVLLLETESMPDRGVLESILCESSVSDLLVAVFSGSSLTGLVNVLSRVVEVGVFRLWNLGFDVNRIISAEGSVPKVKGGKDSMFEANDAIIYHGRVSLTVDGWDPSLTDRIVSRNSKVFGKPFKKLFEESGRDFYNIPEDIFAPADLTVKDKKTKKTYSST